MQRPENFIHRSWLHQILLSASSISSRISSRITIWIIFLNCQNVRVLIWTNVTALEELKEEFISRFLGFKESEKLIDSFSRPFSANISNVPGNIQTELTELQCDSELTEKFKLGLTNFYSKYFDKDNFPNIRLNSLKMMSHFRSTYVCEQLFLKMNFVKNKTRSRLKNDHEALLYFCICEFFVNLFLALWIKNFKN